MPRAASEKSSTSLLKILDLAHHTGSLCAQRVKCSKAGCRCARGQPHEGYYYFFWVGESGRLTKRYVRRQDVPIVRGVIERRRQRETSRRRELQQARIELRKLISILKELP